MKIVSLKGFVTGEDYTVFGLEVAEDDKIILFNPEQIDTIAGVDNLLSLSVRTTVNVDSIDSLGENLKPEKIFHGLKEVEDYVSESSGSASENQMGEDMGISSDDNSIDDSEADLVGGGTNCGCKGCDCKKTPGFKGFKGKPGNFKKPPKGPGLPPVAPDGNEPGLPVNGN